MRRLNGQAGRAVLARLGAWGSSGGAGAGAAAVAAWREGMDGCFVSNLMKPDELAIKARICGGGKAAAY